jgi:hypothetical protein
MEQTIGWASDYIPPRRERRPEPRLRVLYPAIIAYDWGRTILDCTIRDIAEGGARIAFARNSRFPGTFHLIHVRGRVAYDARVIWSSDCQAGVAFNSVLPLGDGVEPSHEFLTRLWMDQVVR